MIRNFLVKQRWRIAETYSFLAPLVGIINTFLYAIIAIGVTDFIELTLTNVTVFVIIVFVVFNLMGYIMDKSRIFAKDREKAFETLNLLVFRSQADYNALKMAYYSKFSKEELSQLLETNRITKMAELQQ